MGKLFKSHSLTSGSEPLLPELDSRKDAKINILWLVSLRVTAA